MTPRRSVTDAANLVGFIVRSRFTGATFVVTYADEKHGRTAVAGGGYWATLDAVTVVAPPQAVPLR